MRISGFASGMDIDQIVKNLMAAHRKPLDRLFQQKQIVEWKREEYRKINTMMLNFRNDKLNQFRSVSNMDAKKAVISGDSSSFSARALSGTSTGSMTIRADQLATSTTIVSSAPMDKPVGLDLSQDTLLSDVFNMSEFSNTLYINDHEITIDPATETIGSLMSKINSHKDANVNAFFDYESGQLSLSSKTTGNHAITIANHASDEENPTNLGNNILIDGFKLTNDTAATNYNMGQNAIVTVNGLQITRESNTFNLNGVEITLHSTSDQMSTVNIVNDVDKMVDTIKSFVNEYNELLSAVNTKLGEERFRTFLPLTAEQKKEMTEDEIKLWEEKSRSGMLKSDSILDSMVNSLRLAMISDVDYGGEKVNITQFGITTGSWAERGKLVIDEEQLRTALETEGDKVTALFTQLDGSNTPTEQKGIFHRLSDIVMDSLNEISSKAGTSAFLSGDHVPFSEGSRMASEIRAIDLRMEDFNRRLAMLESRYFAQFTAMEKSISRFNSQSSIFANYM